MRSNEYDIGDGVRISAAFSSLAGAAADPTAIIAKVKPPSGSIVTYTYGVDSELVKESTGMYHLDLAPDQAGTWYYRWAGTGAVTSAEEKAFIVRASNF